ncbi:efflux RND transporter periplasmic adaptor subunit [Burkholderia gladioli pv. gladioli]|uniref:Efflux transporter, RND family, MFP subunit n=1 Tax=Burkholderia gladioli TaxID=28095 RepID=A0AAW3EPS8_BURGA|nr:efflux RND transporter periplasmic adaptor subunit [Burkholderia gladioli]AJW98417.1 efflux transporter, RND family, MFP subunit [Burkholderia gladioli]ASD79472.1 efflux RND transporter periplasmic adaptor subunit [Burkholderia gladioli pv. gladioli]AWY55284.1 efflux RND transporter periplasmic adaptor subunit [Burkholderia gladioli pv. gladioli]KGC09803.1 efflux transporter, RND family, MFP subunit [Burkholderia gladioli]MDJ1163650.1 efflux RND transporter periplasmic adaptor subunit [Burk
MNASGPRAVVLLGAALLVAACHPKDNGPPPAARPVVATPIAADGTTAAAILPGDIEPRYATPLSFRIGGKIIERSVRLGDTVKKGQVLAHLDPSDPEKNAASAQAQLDAASHALTYAQQQVERDRAQAREKLIAPAQLEQTENAYASARAQRDQAAQQLALAKNQLQYTSLVADHAGYITAEQADTGQNVSAGQAVYQLAWSGDVDVVTDVPETTLAVLQPGHEAGVTLPALPGRSFQARVREIAPAADPQSRTYRVRLTLAEPDPAVRLGMTANVALAGTAADGARYTLPSTALFHEGPNPAVWVIRRDDTLELRRVGIARYGENTITVSQGLQAGERVVQQGVHAVSAGEKVRAVAPLHAEDGAS